MKKVLWIIWTLAAGKDTFAKMISEELQLPLYQISGTLKMIAQERGINPDREYLIRLGRELANKYWDDYLARYLVENAPEEVFIIVWMRQLGQIKYLRENTDFTLVWVEAAQNIRFQRLLERGKFWDPSEWEEFQRIESMEDSSDNAQKIGECLMLVDYMYENNGSLEELKKQISFIWELVHLEINLRWQK